MEWGTTELQFHTFKKPWFMAANFWLHSLSVLSQYFHIVSTKFKMNKILNIFIYQKHNKINFKTFFKAELGTNIFHLNLSIIFCLHHDFLVNSSFNIFLLNTFQLKTIEHLFHGTFCNFQYTDQWLMSFILMAQSILLYLGDSFKLWWTTVQVIFHCNYWYTCKA